MGIIQVKHPTPPQKEETKKKKKHGVSKDTKLKGSFSKKVKGSFEILMVSEKTMSVQRWDWAETQHPPGWWMGVGVQGAGRGGQDQRYSLAQELTASRSGAGVAGLQGVVWNLVCWGKGSDLAQRSEKKQKPKKNKPAQKEGNRVFPQQNTNDHPVEKETKGHHLQLRDALGQLP